MDNYKLLPMSPEQEQIVSSVVNNNNVIVDSVAGSGKTTTCLHICQNLPHKNILILTYNSRLKVESREKIKALQLKNVEVHSYHAFCVKYYTDKGYRDDGIQYTVNNNLSSKKSFVFDIIILDEQQDMTKLFYHLARKIIYNNLAKFIQICSFGDIYQNIYSYAGSDERYLIYANRIFEDVTTTNWEYLRLSTSYRITTQIADFINICLLKTLRLKATKSGPKVKYLITDTFKDISIYDEILKYLNQGYTPEDIFVLGASLKKGKKMSPICRLENKLVLKGIPCHASLSDDTKVDEDIIKGKVCFASFHQVKGMERKICIIYGFDESYFNYYAKNLDKSLCPNVLYVALTRASDRLILIHDCHNNYLPFMAKQSLNKLCDVVIKNSYIGGAKPSGNPVTVYVRDLIKNISNDSMNYIFTMVDYEIIKSKTSNPVELQSKICTKKDLYEDVSDINGLAIPALYEYSNTNEISMLEQIMGYITSKKAIGISYANLPEMHKILISNIYQKYQNSNLNLEDILYISTLYNSLVTGFIGKREQIVHYDWCEQSQTLNLLNIMSNHVSKSAKYEQQIMHCVHNKILVGIVDAIDNTYSTLFEFKCTSELSKEHILQLVIYSYMYENLIKNINESKLNKFMLEYTTKIENKGLIELCELCMDLGVDPTLTINNKNELIELLVKHKKDEIEKQQKPQIFMYKLLNILTEEIIQVHYNDKYGDIIDYLLTISHTKKLSDEEFLAQCKIQTLNTKYVDEINNFDEYMF
jgi:hypothetical protein